MNEQLKQAFGEKLRFYRERAGYTSRYQASNRSGTTNFFEPQLSHWERGMKLPIQGNLMILCDLYNLTHEETKELLLMAKQIRMQKGK